ncbi:diaminopimelate decarboxylase [Bacteriovoracaceae bacterium]|nr:diaminopimelate decarboxylase [Bacteriovoracaceae bacterium]
MEPNQQDYLSYSDDQHLQVHNINIKDIIKSFPTPFYLYSEKILEENYNAFVQGMQKANIQNYNIAYALKANNNSDLIKKLASYGAGGDIVSGGELKCALNSGIAADKIVFSGVGKTDREIKAAIEAKIYSINVESEQELYHIQQIAKELDKIAPISFRLNPEVNVETHSYISTGAYNHKFGLIDSEVITLIQKVNSFTHCEFKGISMHIGSQLLDLTATFEAVEKLCQFITQNNIEVEFIDLGGGLGTTYRQDQIAPKVDDYLEGIKNILDQYFKRIPKIVLEPGRRIMASAGFFITSVLYTKYSREIPFVIVDGGMNDFVRPALYSAYHEIYPGIKNGHPEQKINLVGPICETGDFFAFDRTLPILGSGDFYMVSDTGAYGYSMGSTYNLRDRPIELLMEKNNKIRKIRESQTAF